MAKKLFSFVFPVKLNSKSLETDLRRAIAIAAGSIRKYFDPALIDQFFIIAGKSDLKALKSYAGTKMPKFPFVFIDETALCPCLRQIDRDSGWPGWHIQQVLKISAASIVRTPYYMTLDDDVILTQSVGEKELLKYGKLTTWHYEMSDMPQYIPWFQSDCEVLRTDFSVLSRGCSVHKQCVMGYTPEPLVTEVVRKLQDEIKTLWGVSDYAKWLFQATGTKILPSKFSILNRAYHKLSANKSISKSIDKAVIEKCHFWTEHQLYWTYLRKYQAVERYYTFEDNRWMGKGIWTEEEAVNLDIEKWATDNFARPHHWLFQIVRSYLKNVDKTKLYDSIEKYLA